MGGSWHAGLGTPGVNAIVRQYPTPIALFEAYKGVMISAHSNGRDAVIAATSMLAGMRFSSVRCMSASMSACIYNTLFAYGWQVV